jgi:uncharacterized membrane protein YagU involved in acid resistance
MVRQYTMITTKQRRAVTTILSAWLVGGTLDITTASIYYPRKYNITQILLLQNIASGVFGERAFSGGLRMAVLGLVFHYCIAFFWTIIFFISYTAMKISRRNWFITGMAFGIVVWLVMNLVVLPMSNVNRSPFDPIEALIGAVILIFCIGLPNSAIIGSHYSTLQRLNSDRENEPK